MKDLTKGNPLKLIFQFALPVLLGNVFQLLYNLIDTRIVGETLGEQSLAAVGATNSISSLIIGFLLGLTNGFAIKVAQSFGAKDEAGLRRTTAMSLFLGTVTAIVMTILSVVFLMPLLRVLNTPPEVIQESYVYIRVIFLGMIVTLWYNALASVLRAIGDTVTPLIFLIVGTVLNVGLDFLFINGFHMGVEGAAYATVLAQFISVVLVFVYMWKKYPMLHLHREDFKMEWAEVKEMYASGLSMGIMLSLVCLGTVALQSAINTFGTKTIVAHTAARKITEIYMLLFSVCGTTMATYCGQNLGAGKIGRIKEGIRMVILVTWGWSILMMVASYTIAPWLVHLVTGTEDAKIIHTATLYLRIDTLFYFVPAMITVLRNAMQGIGDHRTPIVSSMIELVGKVLVVFLLVPYLDYMGIILSEPIVWILMVIPLIIKIKTNPVLKEKEKENVTGETESLQEM
ncbi:MATE family efflux transporter [Anaerosporobacter faecicola]|uniref:MATE family efflux transporter n=1 Tax=Anaerosporobacter faecicola TaxID=2718714 RepID=UPI00143B2975|nr:MATE family efflux transporter [Anaerosporobacter faecicola]